MATEPRQASVAQVTFAPFRYSLRLGISILLLWFVTICTQIGYAHLTNTDGVLNVERQIGYYVDKADTTGVASKMATATYAWVFEKMKIHIMLAPKAQPAQQPDTSVTPYLKRSIWAAFRPELLTAAYATVLYAAKLGISLTALPLLLIWVLAFGADGLVQRSIRRSSGGHESAAVYHRAKLYGVRLLPPFAAVIFMCSPWAIPPAFVFVPAALVSAVLLRLQATYYKKYL